jgi:chromosome segregation ATPase
VLHEIEELLTAEAPPLDRLESTLTDGYAQALALEAERWRLERRLGEVAREGRDTEDELSAIGLRLSVADDELSELRSLLSSLRERARHARSASTG